MQEQLQKLAVSKQEVLHCLGIVGAGFLYSLGINLFVVPAGLYTGGIMGFAQLLRTLFLHVTGLELKIDIAGIINYAINLPILCIAWRRIDHRTPDRRDAERRYLRLYPDQCDLHHGRTDLS